VAGGAGHEETLIEWAVAERALAGQGLSGDRHAVRPFPGGVLVAAIDGLGHGEEAARAADMAVATLVAYARDPVIQLVRRCHEALAKTRGVAMSVASIRAKDSTMTWVGVGNVEGVLVHVPTDGRQPRESITLRGGVVGYQLPSLRDSLVTVARGDTLILATDGITGGFADDLDPTQPPRRLADRILQEHCRGTDDALVLVARYLGGAP
jgi:negative regulator of sigma-B (phosphoserine phosphatase)